MAKHEIPNLLDELKSDETYTRNAAIKKIIKNKINEERIITALKDVIENDTSMSVRNFARSSLDVFGIEHSEFEQQIVETRSVEIHTDTPKDDGNHQKNIERETVDDWALIGFFVGLVPGLLFFFLTRNGLYLLTRNDPSLLALNIFLIGPAGVIGSIIGASIGKQGNKSTVIGLSFTFSILGAFLGLVLAFLTCFFCQ